MDENGKMRAPQGYDLQNELSYLRHQATIYMNAFSIIILPIGSYTLSIRIEGPSLIIQV